MIQAASEITEWYNVQQALIEADTYNLIAYCVGRTPQPFQVAAEFTGVSIVSLILMVVGGFFDLLSLGTGVFKAYYNGEGWAWGIFSDSLRLLVVAGPLAKGIKLISVPALTEVLVPAGETPFCTLISTIRALQETRIANFASVEEICLALKIKAQAYGLSEIVGIVKKLGGVSRTLGRTKFLQGIEGRAASNPTRVYLVDLRWKNDWAKGGGDAAHTVMVQYCPAKNCVMWWDPSGAYR